MTGAVEDARVVDNPGERRYELWLGRERAGFTNYALERDRIVFIHTEVDPAFEGRGLGSRLAAGVLADARARGLRVVVECPFIASYVRRHRQQYADLITARGG